MDKKETENLGFFFCKYYPKRKINRGAMIKVIIPEITIDKALIAPSISPISKAFEVPTA